MKHAEKRWSEKRTRAMRLPAIFLLVIASIFMAPSSARACSVCFDLADRAREAYYGTTVLLLLVPMAFIVGIGIWLRRAALRQAGKDESATLRASAPRS